MSRTWTSCSRVHQVEPPVSSPGVAIPSHAIGKVAGGDRRARVMERRTWLGGRRAPHGDHLPTVPRDVRVRDDPCDLGQVDALFRDASLWDPYSAARARRSGASLARGRRCRSRPSTTTRTSAAAGTNLLAIPVDVLLDSAGMFPAEGEGPYALALAYRLAFAVLGGWVTARLAPSSPMKHSWTLGAVGVLFAGLGAAAQWNAGHHWYSLAILVLSLPATWAGARLFVRSQP